MIPATIHFIFGLDENFGGKPFSYFHYLAIRSAFKIHNPGQLCLHYEFEPSGEWWEKSKPFLSLNRIKAPDHIYDREIKDFAHKADVVRLETLQEHGGIYLDMDVISLGPIDSLLSKTVVMAKEHNMGLCNAVILAEPKAPFLTMWLERYRDFDDTEWSKHSVQVPAQLANENPGLIHVLDEYRCFYPMYNDPSQWYLWWTLADFQKFRGKVETDDPVYLQHLKNGREWQLQKLRSSYFLHLWEQAWYDKYLKQITPEYILRTDNNFSALLRGILTKEEIQGINS